MHTLTASKRDASQTLTALRKSGSVPGVVYGPKQESTPISVSRKEFERILKEAGESSVIALAGLSGEDLQVLIHEVDHDPVTSVPRHVDLYAIAKGAKVEVSVPIVFLGESPAVKDGANLVKVMHELPIEASPANLPHDVSVDVSVLAAIGDQIHARDIALPPGVELKVDAEEVVALIQEVQEEKEEAPTEIDMASIEVEKKGKEEAEGEAPAGEPAKA